MSATEHRVLDPKSYQGPAGMVFVLVLAFWLVVPVVQRERIAQDAIPFLVAGDLVREYPDQIYATEAADLYDLPPTFAQRSCALAPPGTACDRFVVAYVASPGALPWSWLLARIGPDLGILLARLLAAGSLVAGMAILRTAVLRRDPAAAGAMAATALLLTPFALLPIGLGQSTPLLFLAAVLGPAGRRTAGTAGRGVLWAFTIVLKAFPAAVGLLAVSLRRWTLLAWAIGGTVLLSASALLVGPPVLFGEFVTAARRMSNHALTNPYNRAPVAQVVGDTSMWVLPGAMAVGLATAVGLWAWRVRRASPDYQWAWAWLASLLVVPLVWWHYLWLAIPVVALASAAAAPRNGRVRWVLPGVAAMTAALTALDGPGAVGEIGSVVLLIAVLVGGAIAAPVDPESDEVSETCSPGTIRP